MDFSLLKTVIAMMPGSETDDQVVADWCNSPSVTQLKQTFITTRTLMEKLGPQAATDILTKLETAAAASSLLAKTLEMMSPVQGGIDVALDSVRFQLDDLAVNNVITQQEATNIKSLGEHLVSPAESVGLPVITAQNVAFVRLNHDD
ncbi:hypothetical protein GCM10007891_05350 [Methylophaga thalassica]|uniref:Uncharacterized protein n=1 Tax=Methylophaga thalassica TaxID=40223 RepID=A0ABQ5TR26_9GAMM|nr:hypothetical protein [Methylophaga thalassica]GLP98681.1 hypothetical protein GCM10007891_05350 [Methylophaga thalassica]